MENKNTRIAIIIASIVFVLAIIFFVFKGNSSKQSVTLPVDPTSQGVTTATVVYNFYGPIKNLQKINNQTNITLNTSNQAIPVIKLNSSTRIYNVTNTNGKKQYVPQGVSALKVGQKIAAITWYNLQDKSWTTQYIYIQSY